MRRWMLHTELESGNEVAAETRPPTHTESREKRERSDTGEIHEEEEKREGEERDLSVERQRGRVSTLGIKVTLDNICVWPRAC